MDPYSIAILVYCDNNSTRDALTEEKYKDLARAFMDSGYRIKSFSYNDEKVNDVFKELSGFDAVLVWVNPIEQRNNRKMLDTMLDNVSRIGCFVSTHPEVILKIGTKDVLHKTKSLGWTGETRMYSTLDEFKQEFPKSLVRSGVKVLKRHRGNGGNGVFKIIESSVDEGVTIIHARNSHEIKVVSWADFFKEFGAFITEDGLLIEQEWNENLANGMVRCYMCGNKVAGFGYQEINAFYELKAGDRILKLPPGKRYYFTENWGLFSDLREIMENDWVPKLQESQAISTDMLPLIWDADFFINNTGRDASRYSLCEINVSCVSPFPPSAIKFMIEETGNRIRMTKNKKIVA